MEDGTTIEVESFSEAHKIPNKKALMSTEFYPQYSQLSPPKKRSWEYPIFISPEGTIRKNDM